MTLMMRDKIDLDALPMRIAVGQINELTDEHLAFARQVGAEDIQMNTPKLPGEHRWEKKTVPYDESIRIPMVLRYDPVTAGHSTADGHLVSNLDVAPTFLDAAGLSEPVQGQSLLSLLRGGSAWPTSFLIEHGGNVQVVPAYCGIRGTRYVYVRYSDGFEELYDLSVDPYELNNRARSADPQLITQLSARLAELAGCAGAGCRAAEDKPVPPIAARP